MMQQHPPSKKTVGGLSCLLACGCCCCMGLGNKPPALHVHAMEQWTPLRVAGTGNKQTPECEQRQASVLHNGSMQPLHSTQVTFFCCLGACVCNPRFSKTQCAYAAWFVLVLRPSLLLLGIGLLSAHTSKTNKFQVRLPCVWIILLSLIFPVALKSPHSLWRN